MNDMTNDMMAIFTQLSEKNKAILILFASGIKSANEATNSQKAQANILDEIMSNVTELSLENQDLILQMTKEIKSQSTENIREIAMKLGEIYTKSPADFVYLKEVIQSRLQKYNEDTH